MIGVMNVDSFVAPQAWAENKVPMMPPSGDLSKDRKVEQKAEVKKKTQAEIEQEMAALQYTNPMLLEVRDPSRFTSPSLIHYVSVVWFYKLGLIFVDTDALTKVVLSSSELLSKLRFISICSTPFQNKSGFVS